MTSCATLVMTYSQRLFSLLQTAVSKWGFKLTPNYPAHRQNTKHASQLTNACSMQWLKTNGTNQCSNIYIYIYPQGLTVRHQFLNGENSRNSTHPQDIYIYISSRTYSPALVFKKGRNKSKLNLPLCLKTNKATKV